jgi:hypothetical protein
MEKRAHITWKEYNVERMEAQSTSIEKSGHSQKWRKKTEQRDMNEGIKNKESFTLYESYAGSRGRIRIHMQGDLEKGCVHTQVVYGTGHVPVQKSLRRGVYR